MKGGVPLMDFIVMEEKPDDFRTVCVDAFVAGIAASVVVIEESVSEIAREHEFHAFGRIDAVRFAEPVADPEKINDRRGNPVVARGGKKIAHVDLAEEVRNLAPLGFGKECPELLPGEFQRKKESEGRPRALDVIDPDACESPSPAEILQIGMADAPSLLHAADDSAEHEPAGVLCVDLSLHDHASRRIGVFCGEKECPVELVPVNLAVHFRISPIV